MQSYHRTLLVFLFTIIIGSGFVYAEVADDSGVPAITNYRSADYDAALENWGIAQDNRGILYFANTKGILEYDGENWRQISLPQKAFVRSLSLGKDGKIYVAAVSDLGVLEPDQQGFLRFHSLKSLLGPQFKYLGEVWDVEAADDGVYFKTRDFLFRISGDSVKTWSARGTFRIYQVDGVIYVRNHGVGLMKLQDDSLQLIPGGERFSGIGVYDMLAHKSKSSTLPNNIVVTTINRGLFIYNGKEINPFAEHLTPLLVKNQLYSSALLPDSGYAFATLRGGIVLTDGEGNLQKILDKSNDLLSSVIYYVYTAPRGGIWLAQNNGISKIDWPSPLSKFGDVNDSRGNVYSTRRYQGQIFVGDDLGAQKLERSPRNGMLPHLIPLDLHDPCYRLMTIDNHLLALANSLMYQFNPDFSYRIIEDLNGTDMVASRYHKNHVYVLSGEQVTEIAETNGNFQFQRVLAAPLIMAGALAEESDSILWVVDKKSQLLRYQYQGYRLARKDSLVPIKRYDGILGEVSSLVFCDGELLFLSEKGAFTYHPEDGQFVRKNILSNSGAGGLPIYRMTKFGEKDWVAERGFEQKKEIGFLIQNNNGAYDWKPLPILNRLDLRYVQEIYPDPEQEVLWIAASDELVRFEYKSAAPAEFYKKPLIRLVTSNEDSVLYGGYKTVKSGGYYPGPELAYNQRNLGFSYSAPPFPGSEGTRYSSLLENFDKNWSAWSKNTQKHYTNLPYGEFRFLVKARDQYGNESQPVHYAFVIAPPWYHSWWAYSIYGIILVMGIFTADRIMSRRIILREREKSRMRELELRARKNEAQAQVTIAQTKALEAENERKRNVELLNNIGKEITASLDFETVFLRLYYHMKNIAPLDIFEIGVLKEEEQLVEFRYSIQEGKRRPLYISPLGPENSEVESCLKQKVMLLLESNNIDDAPNAGTENHGEAEKSGQSIVYIPLVAKKKAFGLLHIVAKKKKGFSRRQLEILQNLAPFAAIALDNAMNFTKLNQTLLDLKATQQRLITQEKLASLGALTAGIAHEIKNPLNFITNFAHLTLEQTEELIMVFQPFLKDLPLQRAEEFTIILENINRNAQKINEHGNRADRIVKSMLEHSGSNRAERRETDINKLLDDALNLAYHGMRAQNSEFNVILEKHYSENMRSLLVNPQELNRVFLNLLNNAFYAVYQRALKAPQGYQPQVKIKTWSSTKKLTIVIWDNGCGVPADIKTRLFDPFFTTKPSGEGTGLGLSLSHEIIVKNYHGEISFKSREGKYTEFIIQLPLAA
ncbi:MAG: hypothetical protein Kow0037_32030 [Calditrichia bacterium]